jgi:hypothetical protein
MQSPKRCVLDNRTMDNVQKHSTCIFTGLVVCPICMTSVNMCVGCAMIILSVIVALPCFMCV